MRIVEPAGSARGDVIVLHDIFGLSDYVDDVLEALAGAGWRAAAPALFHRDGIERVAYDDIDRGAEAAARLSVSGVIDDFDACVSALTATKGHAVAVLGFCLGGALASYLSTRRDLASCVSFYGGITNSEALGMPSLAEFLPAISAPWLGIYGEDDPFISMSDVRAVQARLGEIPAPAEVDTYAGGHAFHRHTTPDYYHPDSAPRAWKRALEWLENDGVVSA